MDTDFKNRVTRSDLHAVSNLVEDTCSEPGCAMTILVDRDLKEQGRKSRCMACIMRNKIARGDVR